MTLLDQLRLTLTGHFGRSDLLQENEVRPYQDNYRSLGISTGVHYDLLKFLSIGLYTKYESTSGEPSALGSYLEEYGGGIETTIRYPLPFWNERIRLFGRLGYDANYNQANLNFGDGRAPSYQEGFSQNQLIGGGLEFCMASDDNCFSFGVNSSWKQGLFQKSGADFNGRRPIDFAIRWSFPLSRPADPNALPKIDPNQDIVRGSIDQEAKLVTKQKREDLLKRLQKLQEQSEQKELQSQTLALGQLIHFVEKGPLYKSNIPQINQLISGFEENLRRDSFYGFPIIVLFAENSPYLPLSEQYSHTLIPAENKSLYRIKCKSNPDLDYFIKSVRRLAFLIKVKQASGIEGFDNIKIKIKLRGFARELQAAQSHEARDLVASRIQNVRNYLEGQNLNPGLISHNTKGSPHSKENRFERDFEERQLDNETVSLCSEDNSFLNTSETIIGFDEELYQRHFGPDAPNTVTEMADYFTDQNGEKRGNNYNSTFYQQVSLDIAIYKDGKELRGDARQKFLESLIDQKPGEGRIRLVP